MWSVFSTFQDAHIGIADDPVCALVPDVRLIDSRNRQN
jgi:hypothetical protein